MGTADTTSTRSGLTYDGLRARSVASSADSAAGAGSRSINSVARRGRRIGRTQRPVEPPAAISWIVGLGVAPGRVLTPQNLQAPPQAAPTAQARQLSTTVQHAGRGIQTGVRREAGRSQRLCQRRDGAAFAPCPQCRDQRKISQTAGIGRAHQGIVEAARQVHCRVACRTVIVSTPSATPTVQHGPTMPGVAPRSSHSWAATTGSPPLAWKSRPASPTPR